jgi:general secretion pathway protein A
MYLSFYQLTHKPFQITADPAFLWLGEKHTEALATLKYGILEDKGFLLLTGDVGTGKTALIRLLIKTIDVAAIVATIPDPGMETIDFFNVLASEFRMNRRFASKGEFLIEFKQFLLKAYSSRRKVLLIVDEAQRLSVEMLEQVRLLSNIELDNRKLINIFFVGQTEFNRVLLDERSKAVRQRITVSYHIEPLKEAETPLYIKHRLNIAGARSEIFTPAAIRRIHAFSRGYPRLINIICDHALLTGYAAGANPIEPAIIQACEKELGGPESFKAAGREAPGVRRAETAAAPLAVDDEPAAVRGFGWKLPALLIFLLLLGFTGYMVYQYRSQEPQRWALEDIAPQTYKGLSGQPTAAEPPEPAPGEEPSEHPPAPAAVPPVAVAGDGNAPQAASSETLAANPFDSGRVVIFFPHNSNELTPEALAVLDRIAQFLKSNRHVRATITGYTDSVGSESYNVNVSQFRANSIKSYLAGRGVDAAGLMAVGLGPKNPIARNDTSEGRQKNRRVEIELAKE